MVSIILRGGLGNQLFQYATGRAHALRTDSELYVDLSRLGHDRGPDVETRSLYLDAFNLSKHLTRKSPKSRLRGVFLERVPRALAAVSPRLAASLFGFYVDDDPQIFDPQVMELPGDCTLNGYWQSERYFDEFADVLRDEIVVSDPPCGENKVWYDRIQDHDSISVHVRRGDYVSLGCALPPAYYRNALTQLHRETGADTLFFFSDDMDWVRSHNRELLPARGNLAAHYVECNDGESAHEDLRLMRACDAHVIANSTFSWWGAWLAEPASRHIIAPEYWFESRVDQLDIVPDRWTVVDW